VEIAAKARVLARCNGFLVATDGKIVGAVATPVFSGTNLLPDYLLMRVAETLPGAYRAIPPALIAAIDEESCTVTLGIPEDEVAKLAEADLLLGG
jgi:hypothetical protein